MPITADTVRRYGWLILSTVAVLVVTAAIGLWMGRLPFGPDRRIGL